MRIESKETGGEVVSITLYVNHVKYYISDYINDGGILIKKTADGGSNAMVIKPVGSDMLSIE